MNGPAHTGLAAKLASPAASAVGERMNVVVLANAESGAFSRKTTLYFPTATTLATLSYSLLREELGREDHPSLIRLGDAERPMWWLRAPELDEAPLADRVEWATFSILTTAGRLDENGFLERIYVLFPGLEAPDEELVRACLAPTRWSGRRELRSEEDLAERQGTTRG
jgi:hypothetical protein